MLQQKSTDRDWQLAVIRLVGIVGIVGIGAAGCGRQSGDIPADVLPESLVAEAARTKPFTTPADRLLEVFEPPALDAAR